MRRLVRVKVFPGSSKSGLQQKSENSFVAKLKSQPRGGKANKELLSMLSSFFGIPEKNIRISRGLYSRNKIIEINTSEKDG